MNKPVLFCFDGSDGSRTALTAAAEWITPTDAVVLTVWTPAAIQLARAGSFVVAIPNEGEVDEQEAASAKQIAEDGAAAARTRGYNAVARVAQAGEAVVRTIEEVLGVHLMEFGIPEAMWHLRVRDFLAIVTMDAHGNSLHADVEKETGDEPV